MCHTIRINGHLFYLPVEASLISSIEYSPFRPEPWSNTQHSWDMGVNVSLVTEGIYLQHYYDHGRDRLQKEEYSLVITQPQLVRKPLTDFTLHEQAEFSLAKLVYEVTGRIMANNWNIYAVDNIPPLSSSSISSPNNTSSVSTEWIKVSAHVFLLITDGWTGVRDFNTCRDLYVLKSAYPGLASK